tara:strand:+ start:928 stop:3126 length:2199 start_codon:yes stop_codon:yes gene_type:complete
MANFSKSFNFRNGVQVDNDKFIVKPTTGLVGIGSTSPTQVLDVVGNIKANGVVNSANVEVGTGITVGINSSISIDGVTGLITAVSYFGDGSTLTNVVAIATAGFTELSGTLSTTHSVGIGSTQPFDFKLDVIGAARVVGPSTFVGVTTVSDLFADALGVSGVSKLTGGTIVESGATINQANVTGVSTFGGDISANGNIIGDSSTNISGISSVTASLLQGTTLNATGNSTLNDVSITGSVTSNLTVDGDVSLAGVATFTNLQDIIIQPRINTKGFKIRKNDGTDIFQVYPNNNPPTAAISGKFFAIDTDVLAGLTVAGVSTYSKLVDVNNRLDVVGGANIDQLNVTGVSTLTGRLTATEIASATGNEVKILHDGTQVATTLGAGVSVSNTVRIGSLNGGTNNLSTLHGEVSYGVESGLTLYSRRKSLNVVNFDTGNLNYYLNATNTTIGGVDYTGDFNWLKGISNDPIMTLTGIGGSLGIGITNPSNNLEVIGTSRFTGKMILNNVDVGDTPVAKILQSASTSQNISGIFSGSHYGNIIDEKGFNILSKGTGIGNTEFTDTFFTGNVHTNAGISTMKRLRIGDTDNVSGTLSVRSGALEEPSSGANPVFTVNTKESPASIEPRFRISRNGQVGIRTSANSYGENIGIDANNTSGVIGMLAVGFGATDPVTSGFGLDLTYAGRNVKSRQMVLPKVNTTERDAFEANTVGAVIYNTQLQKIQVYTGSSWETVTSS